MNSVRGLTGNHLGSLRYVLEKIYFNIEFGMRSF